MKCPNCKHALSDKAIARVSAGAERITERMALEKKVEKSCFRGLTS